MMHGMNVIARLSCVSGYFDRSIALCEERYRLAGPISGLFGVE